MFPTKGSSRGPGGSGGVDLADFHDQRNRDSPRPARMASQVAESDTVMLNRFQFKIAFLGSFVW